MSKGKEDRRKEDRPKKFNKLDVDHIRDNHTRIVSLEEQNKAQAEALARLEARLAEVEMKLEAETKDRKLQEEKTSKQIDRVNGAIGDLNRKVTDEKKSVAELKALFEKRQEPTLYANFNPAGQSWVEKSGSNLNIGGK